MPTAFPPTRTMVTPAAPNTTFFSEDFGAYVDAYTNPAGKWPLNIAIDLDPMVWMLTPVDTPLTGTNTADGGVVMPTQSADAVEIFWGTEDIVTPYSTLKVAIAATGTTALDVQDSARFRVNDYLMVGAGAQREAMLVTAVVDADTLTVTRAQLGTTAQAAIAINSPVYAIGRIAPEGSDPVDLDARDLDLFSNYMQILGPYRVAFTKTAQAIRRTLRQDEVAYQIAQRIKEINLRREFTFYNGVKYKSGRTRSMGGIRSFVAGAGKVDSTSTALDVTAIGTMLGQLWGRGGQEGNLILQANPAAMVALNAANNSQVQVTYGESRRGLTPVTFVDTEYGSVQILRNRWIPANEAIIHRSGQFIRRVLRNLQTAPLPSTGDWDAWMIVGEETLEVQAPQISGIFTNLNYTSSVSTSG